MSQNRPLAGKIALVTGATRGIGRATVQAFLDAGVARVYGTATSSQSWMRSFPGAPFGDDRFVPLILDLGQLPTAVRLSMQLQQDLRHLDILVHNAGILGVKQPIDRYPIQTFQQVMGVNVTGTFYLTQLLLPLLRSSQAASVLFLSSSVGRKGKAGVGAYGVSKFAVEGLMQILADECRGSAVRVNSYDPRATRTDMRAAYNPSEDPLTLPEASSHAAAMVWLASDAAAGVHGQALDPESWATGAGT